MDQLNFKLQVKSLDEQGRFSGLASVYNVVDLGSDVVVPGAFQKTLQDRGGEIPILFAHDSRQPVGLGKLSDTAAGLAIEGQLVLDVGKAKEAYSLLKAKVLRGLSIGYDTVKSDMKDGVRYLRELKLFEVSLVVMPMNQLAVVSAVKTGQHNVSAEVEDFLELVRDCRETWRR
jgi:HK97 family phage prohead protease